MQKKEGSKNDLSVDQVISAVVQFSVSSAWERTAIFVRKIRSHFSTWGNHEYLIWPSIQPLSVFSFDVMKDPCTTVRYSNYVVFSRTRWQLRIILSWCTHTPYRYVRCVDIILYVCHGISSHWREARVSVIYVYLRCRYFHPANNSISLKRLYIPWILF